jgi:hypothetical protein
LFLLFALLRELGLGGNPRADGCLSRFRCGSSLGRHGGFPDAIIFQYFGLKSSVLLTPLSHGGLMLPVKSLLKIDEGLMLSSSESVHLAVLCAVLGERFCVSIFDTRFFERQERKRDKR